MIRVKRALVSVYHKTGIVDFARTLAELGVEIISTGATARELSSAGIPVVAIESVTGWPEMFAGRLKTLTPQIHGGLLMRRDNAQDRRDAEAHGIRPIDLLCVNLYPFAETVARAGDDRAACIEMIDIGGPAMIRAAAKNHHDVIVVSAPSQYAWVAAMLREHGGSLPRAIAARLACEAFATTAAYDADVFEYLWRDAVEILVPGEDAGEAMPQHWAAGGERLAALRYGENPGQRAACYVSSAGFWRRITIHQGKELSYNNLGDVWAAYRCAREFTACAGVVVKHATPSGVALAATATEAFARARDADALSAYGGIVAVNRTGDADLATALAGMFLEVVAAPRWDPDALAILSKRRALRVLSIPDLAATSDSAALTPPLRFAFRSVGDGALVQTLMPPATPPASWQHVAGPAADAACLAELDFAWRVVRHVRSNAIALARDGATIGLGGGQTSRIDALDVALLKAGRSGHATAGSVLASDAFFPFRDVADRAAGNGVRAIVQPGGSRHDDESIAACNEHGIAMYFTGQRVFAH